MLSVSTYKIISMDTGKGISWLMDTVELCDPDLQASLEMRINFAVATGTISETGMCVLYIIELKRN